jgi:hypothetical protein
VSSIKNILSGERVYNNEERDGDSDDDSIMADIQKIPICKPPGAPMDISYVASESRNDDEDIDAKSELFGDGSRRGGSELPIEIDEEEVISDFD